MTRKQWDKGGKTRHEQGYGSRWDKLRVQILQRDKYLCQACLRKGRLTATNLQVDHIKPKAKGGTDDPANLEVLCRPCHEQKSRRDRGHKIKRAFGADGWPIEDYDQ